MGELAVAPAPVNTTAGSFDALYRSAADDVHAYAMSLLHDRAAAEDVTMAAFERAYRARDKFDPRRGSQRAWLFAIARNAALDELRRRRRAAPLTAGAHAAEGGGSAVETSVAAEESDPLRRASVRAALDALDPRERELIALKFIAGLSNAEIGEVIGASASNAGTRLHRVVTKLREACHAPS